jgi:hypothetical protein
MSTSKINARFAYNNYIDAATFQTTASKTGYPNTNLLSGIRSKLWKPENLFEVQEKNCKVYINGTEYTIPQGSYSSAALITAFNAISGIGATLSQGDTGFSISFATSKTLNLSNQTNAAWELFGFLSQADKTGLAIAADEYRANSGAWLKIDLGLPQFVDFAALLTTSGDAFLSNTATIRLQGNNLDLWNESLPVDLELDVSDEGAFFAGEVTQPCRFWRLLIEDKTNDDLQIAVAYIGSAVICTNTNVATGFTRSREDTSVKLVSENGTFYIDRRPKVLSLSSISVQLLRADELLEMEQLFYDLGIEKPFFLCIDPKKQVSTKLSQMTHYVSATNPLQLQHVLRDYYNLSIELREVI